MIVRTPDNLSLQICVIVVDQIKKVLYAPSSSEVIPFRRDQCNRFWIRDLQVTLDHLEAI